MKSSLDDIRCETNLIIINNQETCFFDETWFWNVLEHMDNFGELVTRYKNLFDQYYDPCKKCQSLSRSMILGIHDGKRSRSNPPSDSLKNWNLASLYKRFLYVFMLTYFDVESLHLDDTIWMGDIGIAHQPRSTKILCLWQVSAVMPLTHPRWNSHSWIRGELAVCPDGASQINKTNWLVMAGGKLPSWEEKTRVSSWHGQSAFVDVLWLI